MRLDEDIKNIKGIGDKTAQQFNRLGIYNVKDLIYYYPRAYKTYSEPVSVVDTNEGDRVAVFCKVVSYVDVHKGRRYTITSLSAADSTGSIRMVWFNMPFLRSKFHKGETYIFYGTVKYSGNMRVMEMPEYFTQFTYQKALSTMQPIYPLKSGITNNSITRSVSAVMDTIKALPEYLPEDVIQQNNLMSRSDALIQMHFPDNEETLKKALSRIAFDEFLEFLIKIRQLKEDTVKQENLYKINDEAIAKKDGFIAGLPFSLTQGQSDAVKDICSDMSSDHVMNRLIQGDVGSGKTVVAVIALLMNAISGYQGALMVPTEVLAVQHYEDICKMLKPYKLTVRLLTGSMSLKEKREVYQELKEGICDIVIGTHAIIQDSTDFKSLGLVITDEQHRFGVKQREKLTEKGNFPHVLVMSATPIPRTLAIILYADMDISVIKDMPSNRKKIMNCVVGTEYRPNAYNFIRKQVAEGHQAYVICPMVEDSEAVEAENVINYSDELSEKLGRDIRVAYLHGKMKEDEKKDILHRFINKEIDVLVSTTVIEVGINNPNATVMMIENAERFGLAQLHQLRGRVGRGDAQSYAVFINVKKSEASMERLKVLEDSNDGFFIASEDLRLRGPGDFFGIRQSGDMNFRIADIYNHSDMLRLAQDVSLKYNDLIVI
ncbi:MAG: ATP-dependent DNA helicase RecG [Eubacterium sp.]|nr:ATP-dependent DNA helicase RecG [Eubacterium sp.]